MTPAEFPESRDDIDRTTNPDGPDGSGDALGRLAEILRERLDAGQDVDAVALEALAHEAGVTPDLAADCLAGLRALAGPSGPDLWFPATVTPGGGSPDAGIVPDLPAEFEIEGELGRGGMGIVYRARQRSLGRRVALKVLRPGDLMFGDAIRRFRKEAEALARLRHPHIVTIHEVGDVRGQVWYSMDLIEGHSLAQAIGPGGMTVARAVRILREVASAVAFTHGKGLIHRDLKPANILLDADDTAFVSDFGLAREVGAGADLTQTGQLLGTPAYMSPEQAAGDRERVGEASDIHALGAILFECLAGRPAFRGANAVATLQAVIQSEAPRVRSVNPKCPADLDIICAKAMAKSPARRYATAQALLEDLDRFEGGRPILARPPSLTYRLARLAGRHRAPLLAGLGVAVVLVRIFLGLLWPGSGGDPETLLDTAARLRASGQTRAALEVYEEARKVPAARLDPVKRTDLANACRRELAAEALDGGDAAAATRWLEEALREGRAARGIEMTVTRTETGQSSSRSEAGPSTPWDESGLLADLAFADETQGAFGPAADRLAEFRLLRDPGPHPGDMRQLPVPRLMARWEIILRSGTHPAHASARVLIERLAAATGEPLAEVTRTLDRWRAETEALSAEERARLLAPAHFRAVLLQWRLGRWTALQVGPQPVLLRGPGETGLDVAAESPPIDEVSFEVSVPGFSVGRVFGDRVGIRLVLSRLPAEGRACQRTSLMELPILDGAIDAPSVVAALLCPLPETAVRDLLLVQSQPGVGGGEVLHLEGWRKELARILDDLTTEFESFTPESRAEACAAVAGRTLATQLDIARRLSVPEARDALRRLDALGLPEGSYLPSRILLARAMAGDPEAAADPRFDEAVRDVFVRERDSDFGGGAWWWLHLAGSTESETLRARALAAIRAGEVGRPLAEALADLAAEGRIPTQTWIAGALRRGSPGSPRWWREALWDPAPVICAAAIWALALAGLAGLALRSERARGRGAALLITAGVLAAGGDVRLCGADLLPDAAGYAVAAAGAAALAGLGEGRRRYLAAAALGLAAAAVSGFRFAVARGLPVEPVLLGAAFAGIAALPSLAGRWRARFYAGPTIDPWSAVPFRGMFLILAVLLALSWDESPQSLAVLLSLGWDGLPQSLAVVGLVFGWLPACGVALLRVSRSGRHPVRSPDGALRTPRLLVPRWFVAAYGVGGLVVLGGWLVWRTGVYEVIGGGHSIEARFLPALLTLASLALLLRGAFAAAPPPDPESMRPARAG